MSQKRPLHINPLAIKLPLAAWVSITHRISGILVFLLIPMLLWSLGTSLASPEGLAQTKDIFANPVGKLFGWVLFAALIFHLIAGIRHLLMDLHFGDSYQGGRVGAWLIVILFIVIMGVSFWFWG